MSEIKHAFSGEVLLRRWSDSSTQGVQVTFALADTEELEPLKALIGKRMACVLVPINDDETVPTQPVKPRPKDTRGPYCREACDLCKSDEFRAFVSGIVGDQADEAMARDWLLAECGEIASRKEIDSDPIATELFIERVRRPFYKWQRQKRRAA